MWQRMLEKGGKACIYPEVLTMYRIHNSSTTFTRMTESNAKRRFTEYCMCLRRSGQQEVTFEQFMQLQKSRSCWKRFAEAYEDYTFYQYKLAIAAVAAKRRWAFLLHGGIFALLNPERAINAIRKKSVK